MLESTQHSNINEQEKVLSRLNAIAVQAPLREKLFFNYGEIISYLISMPVGFVAWRAGFRGYNLHRYGKGRISSLAFTAVLGLNSALFHEHMCKSACKQPYRSENILDYGYKAALAHQFSASIMTGTGLGITFLFGLAQGTLPLPASIHERGIRKLALGTFFGRIKPYRMGIATTWAATTLMMAAIGMAEYYQSNYLLKKYMNRNSIVQQAEL